MWFLKFYVSYDHLQIDYAISTNEPSTTPTPHNRHVPTTNALWVAANGYHGFYVTTIAHHHCTKNHTDKGSIDVVSWAISFFSLFHFTVVTVILDNTQVKSNVSPPFSLANPIIIFPLDIHRVIKTHCDTPPPLDDEPYYDKVIN